MKELQSEATAKEEALARENRELKEKIVVTEKRKLQIKKLRQQ